MREKKKVIGKREVFITLILTLKFSYEEAQKLLRVNGEAELYARDRRDSIIIWAIYHKKEIEEVNVLCKKYHCDYVYKFTEIMPGVRRINVYKGESDYGKKK